LISTAAILAGGLATRLGDLTRETPKSLLSVAGAPFIRWQLKLLRANGVEKVVVCVGHLGELVEKEIGDGSEFGLAAQWSYDGPKLLGTGGALRRALPLLGESFMVIYGDSYLDTDYQAIARAFQASGHKALMTVYRNAGRYETGNVIYRDDRVELYDKRHPRPGMCWVDYGLGCFEADIIRDYPADAFDLADFYEELSGLGRLAGYEVKSRFYEIGSPGGLAELDALLKEAKLSHERNEE